MSIQATHPNIAKEYSDIKKIDLISYGSNQKVRWVCLKCKQEHLMSPNNRCNQGSGCPYCAGRYPTSNNCLSKIRPDLAQELLNESGSDICPNSNKLFDWKCSCCDHIWQSTANNRFRGRGCPKCCKKIQNLKKLYLNC